MINEKLLLKELLSKTIEPAILVVDEKLCVQYHSPNTAHFIKLPKIFNTLKQVEIINKIAFTSITKDAINSIKSYADIKISENIAVKNKNYSIKLKVQKLQTESLKDALFSISISKSNSIEIVPVNRHHQNGEKSKTKKVKILEDKLTATLCEIDLLKEENGKLKADIQTINKSKRAQLQEAESWYKNLFDNSIDGVGVFDLAKQEVVEINDSLVKMTGFSNEEYIARAPFGVFTENLEDGSPTKDLYIQMVSHLVKGGNKSVGHFLHLHKTKAPFHVKISAFKLPKPNQHIAVCVTRNIDERKKAEAKSALHLSQLKVSEAMHKAFFNQSLDGHVILNEEDMMPVEVNKRMLQIMRISKTEYFNANPIDFFDAENNSFNVEETLSNFKVSLEKNRPFEIEVYIKTKKRKSFLVKVLINQLPAPNQHLVYAVIKDINKEQKAEEAATKHLTALTASESMHKTFFNHSLDAHIILSAESMVAIEVNHRTLKLLRISKTEFFKTNLYAFCDSTKNNITQAQFYEAIQASLAKNIPYEAEMYMKSKKRKSFLAKLLINQMPAPNEHLIYSVIKDIDSERKAKEAVNTHLKALTESESLFRTFFENGQDGFAIGEFLPKPKPIDGNPRLCEMLGLSKKEYLSSNPNDFFSPIQPNNVSVEEIHKKMTQNLSQKGIYKGEVIYVHKKNGPFYVNLTMIRLKPPNDNKVFVQAADKDKEVKALQQVAKSEALFRTFFENGQDGFAIGQMHPEPKQIDANPRICELLGLSKKEFLSLSPLDFLSPVQSNNRNAKDIVNEVIQNVKQKGFYKGEVVYIHKKNGPFYANLSVVNLKPPNENQIFIQVTDKDKEVKALQQVAASESMFRTFFENGLDGFTIAQLFPKPKLIDVNPRMSELFGLSKKEFTTSNIQDLLNPIQSNNKSGKEVFNKITESLIQKGFYRGEVVYIHKKKGPFYANITMVRLKSPNENKIFIQIADKDKEVKALKQLAKSEAIFKSIFANSLDGIIIYDIHNFETIECSDRLLENINCTLQQFKNHNIKDYLPTKQPDGKASFPTLKKLLKNVTKNESIRREWVFKKYKSNELIYTRISIIKLPKPFTKLAVVSIADITKTKLAEQSILEKNKAIEQVNQELSISLKKFKDTFDNSANFIGRLNLKGQLVEHNLTVFDKLIDKNAPSTNIYIWNFPWYKDHKDTKKQLKQDFELAKNGQSTKSQVSYTISPNFIGVLEYTFKPLKDEKGKVTAILGEGYDVTEQVNTLKKLEFNEQKFRAIFSNSSNFIGIFNSKGIILDVNQTVKNNLNDKKASSLGIPIWNFPWFLKHKNAQQALKNGVKQAAQGKKAEGIVNYTIPNRLTGTMQFAITPIFDDAGKVAWLLGESKDISTIINAQRELSYKEQKFRAIFNNSSNLIGLYDTKGYIEELNQPLLKEINESQFSGASPKIKMWNIPWIANFKESQLAFKKGFKKVLKGEIDKGIVQYSPAANQTGIFEYTLSPIFDEDNKVIRILGEGKDITEKIEAQKEIAASEKRFRDLFYNARNKIVRLSPNGQILSYNKIYKANKDYSKKYIGKYLWEFLLGENRKTSYNQIKQDFAKAANGELVSGVVEILRSRAEKIVLNYSLKPVFGLDNKVEWVLGESSDITEFINTQNKLLKNEQKFRAIFYNSDNYIVRLDAKGNILEYNHACRDNPRYNIIKKFFGRPLWEIPSIAGHPKSVMQIKKDISKCAKGNFVSNQMQTWVYKTNRKNTQPGYTTGLIAYSLTPVFDKNQKVEWILVEGKDITELNEAKNKLSVSLDKYQKLFENNLVGILTLNENLKVVECNEAYEKITGYSLKETKTFNYYDLIDKNEVKEAKKNEHKVRTTKVKSLQFKRTFAKKNGGKVVVNLYLKPIYVNNKFSSAVVTIADVTELENNRKVLKQSEELYKAVFEGVNDGLYVYDVKKHKVITLNNRLLQIAGLKSKTQFFKQADKQFIPYLKGENKLKINWIKKISRQLKIQKVAKFDFSFEKAKSTSLDISASTIKLTDSLSLTAITDITETKKAQTALLESEIRYRSLFENNVTGIALGNKFGEILQVNKALCTMFGYSEKEMLQLKHQDLSKQGEDDQSYIHFKAMVEGRKKKFSTSKQFTRKNGDSFYAIIFVSGIYDEKNNFKYNITSISDISELKSLEYELKEKQVELADKVVELEKYIESNLELENFAFIASHDLKSPTRTIINYSNLLIEKAEKKLDTVELQFLKFIVEGSARLQNTISDLLNFSLANNNSLSIKKVNLNNLLKNIIKDLNSTIIETKATIQIEGLPHFNRVDKGLYKQLFLNLISNALKFHSKRKPPVVKITCKKTDSNYLFSVEDNGIGIPKKFQQKIFGIFKRLHIYSEFEGTGIGLALCKKVVERHKGKIWVESAKGKGATFYFTLPFKTII